jgi:hypothetical protein
MNMSQDGDERNRRDATDAASDGIRASKPYQPVANPDDPLVRRPPRGPKGPLPGPNYIGLPGRIAIVQGQVFLVAVILIAQLWLITDALYELLSGHSNTPGWLALVSFIGFVLALIITFWPRRRIDES